MGSPHYTQSGNPRGNKTAFAQQMRAEFALIEAGMEQMALHPLVLYIEDANEFSGNQYYRVPVPFKCDIEKVYITVGAANSGSNTPLWVYDWDTQPLSTSSIHVWSIPSTAVAGDSYFFTANANNTDKLPHDPVSGSPGFQSPGGLRVLVQGNQNVVMPVYVTALIRRVN